MNDLSLLNKRPLFDYISFLRNNLRYYSPTRSITSLAKNIHQINFNVDLPVITQNWLEQFASFAHEITELRFSLMQGKAFQLIRNITKYDHFFKRDGSVISIVKDKNDQLCNSEPQVNKILIDYLRERDDNVANNNIQILTTKPVSLSPFTH